MPYEEPHYPQSHHLAKADLLSENAGPPLPAYAVAGVAALVLASRHTLPLHDLTVYHVIFRAMQTITSFALAALCVALARAAKHAPVSVPLIGVFIGAYSLLISLLASTGHQHPVEAIGGALLATCGAMVGLGGHPKCTSNGHLKVYQGVGDHLKVYHLT